LFLTKNGITVFQLAPAKGVGHTLALLKSMVLLSENIK